MGLSELIERPRNWKTDTWGLTSNISVASNANFAGYYAPTVSGSEFTRSWIFPYDVIIERMGFWYLANSLDALSTNTWTLRNDGSDTTAISTVTDSTPTATLQEVTAIGERVTAGDIVSMRWNSDSTGTIGIRIISVSCRIVNPRA